MSLETNRYLFFIRWLITFWKMLKNFPYRLKRFWIWKSIVVCLYLVTVHSLGVSIEIVFCKINIPVIVLNVQNLAW